MTRRILIAAAALLTLASTALLVADANHPTGIRGILLIDKVGGQIRFIDPVTYKERAAFKVATNPHDFVLTADRKTAYVPLYGDGIYGRNPNPGHEVVIVDMEAQKIVGTIDVAPYRAPHGIQRLRVARRHHRSTAGRAPRTQPRSSYPWQAGW